jgi:hypothetical protein
MDPPKKPVTIITDGDPMTAGKLRVLGLIMIPCGVGLIPAQGWYAWGLIPVPRIGYFFTAVGVVTAIFATPLHRRLARKRGP